MVQIIQKASIIITNFKKFQAFKNISSCLLFNLVRHFALYCKHFITVRIISLITEISELFWKKTFSLSWKYLRKAVF